MTKPHSHVNNNVHLGIWRVHTKFQLVRPSNSFRPPKLLPVGVAMTIPHPHVVNSTEPVTWKPHAKFQPDLSSD